MSALNAFNAAFAASPLIAILRGVKPDEVGEIGDALVAAGFTLIEIPLNSPDPFESIALLARRLEGRAVVGAGTVLSAEQADRVAAAGGVLVVSPNMDSRVIAHAAARGLVPLPGIMTPTEAFAALEAGAAALKLFPAEAVAPAMVKAIRAVLPHDARVIPVGGVTPQSLPMWSELGAAGFGLGSALYKPGMSAAEVFESASAFTRAWRELVPEAVASRLGGIV